MQGKNLKLTPYSSMVTRFNTTDFAFCPHVVTCAVCFLK